MSRKILQAARCSQMTSPVDGTGSGGNRCTEACAAMIDVTYKLGPKARAAQTPADVEQIMRELVGIFPGNAPDAIVSHLENFGIAFPQWLHKWGYDKQISLNNYHLPQWSHVKEVIDRQHIAVVGVNNYGQLKQFNNTNPYQWDATGTHAGHVLMLVGYDDNFNDKWGQTIIVNDPLRGHDHMPWDYSFKSLQNAVFSDLTEVLGTPLPFAYNSDQQAPAPVDKDAQIADLTAALAQWERWYTATVAAAPKTA